MKWFKDPQRIHSREEWASHEEFSFPLENLKTSKEILEAILKVKIHNRTTFFDLGDFINLLIPIIKNAIENKEVGE